MSRAEDARMVRAGIGAARDRRTIESFNDEIGDGIERDALEAFDRIMRVFDEHPKGEEFIYADGRVCWAHREGQNCCADEAQPEGGGLS